MNLFNFFKKKSKGGGYIKALKLEAFWGRLSEEEKESLRECFIKINIDSISKATLEMMDGENYTCKNVEMTGAEFLYMIGSKALAAKKYELAEKTLVEAAKTAKESVLKHTVLNELINIYYKQREEKEDAIEKCKNYCWESIELFPKIKEKEEEKEIESFKRLAIIFEKEENYKEAIKVSELAILYGLTDGTKGGYEGRISKLMKKLS